MSSLLRHSLRLPITRAIISRPTALTTSSSTPPPPRPTLTRAYASKKKSKTKQQQKAGDSRNTTADDAESEFPLSPGSKRAPVSTASLTPGSQQALTDPAARDECARADAKMAACVEWFRREVARLESRASGRVTPQLLDPVRVSGVAPPSASASASASSSDSGHGAGAKKVRLEEVATVGVRDGSTLIVTVFDPQVSLWLVVACTPLPPPLRCFPFYSDGVPADWARTLAFQ
jgi:ribosome recycling factor